MFKHQFKTVCKNLAKHKRQNLISVIGLAVGFTCFVLSVFWIRYEMTYDSFHPNADRLFGIALHFPEFSQQDNGLTFRAPYPLAADLSNRFPEIEAATPVYSYAEEASRDDDLYNVTALQIDSSFFRIFHLDFLVGSNSFVHDRNQAAVSAAFARKLYGSDDPIGKKFLLGSREVTVSTVVKNWEHTNLPFDVIVAISPYSGWDNYYCQTYVRLQAGVDPAAFQKKINREKTGNHDEKLASRLRVVPAKELHRTVPQTPGSLKFSYVFLFALVGLLVILCSLLNYLNLFINSLRSRSREFAVRKVLGASDRRLFKLLLYEIILILTVSMLLGAVLIEWVLPAFKRLSEIPASDGVIYLSALGYAGLIFVAAILLAALPAWSYFRKQPLYASSKGNPSAPGKDLFRKGCIALQLVICIGFIFCTTILFRQTYYLQFADSGVAKENLLVLHPGVSGKNNDAIFQLLGQQAVVEDLTRARSAIFPAWTTSPIKIADWENKPVNRETLVCDMKCVDKRFLPFYEISLIAGKNFTDNSTDREIIINETTLRNFNWQPREAVGKSIMQDNWGQGLRELKIIGVVKDFYSGKPTDPVQPVVFVYELRDETFIIKHRPGDKLACMQTVENLIANNFPDARYQLVSVEDEQARFFRSEKSLFTLLGFVSAVCIIISLFGIYSLTALNCERRKKEIAIRKTMGASTPRILLLFYREYLILLAGASVVAFSAGYLIMKPWTEHYTRQIAFSPFIYLAVFTGTLLCILLTINWIIRRTARIRPADVIRSE